jgi:putative phosphoribosyl transferase
MSGVTRLVVVPGATPHFEEPGALERVAELARDWFTHHLRLGICPGDAPSGASPPQGEVT